MINKNKPTVIWDWNGTLIDDVQICIQAMNYLLGKRNLELLTLERYKEVFTFPVKEYYKEVGFNFNLEPFEKPAIEFIDIYKELLKEVKLFGSVEKVLQQIKEQGYNQVIVSAMEEESLKESVKSLGIYNYFDAIAGITDHFANSKSQRGQHFIQKHKLNPSNMVFIGDTLHDKEVADDLGCSCILISNGHQSRQRLYTNENIVTDSLIDALQLVIRMLSIN